MANARPESKSATRGAKRGGPVNRRHLRQPHLRQPHLPNDNSRRLVEAAGEPIQRVTVRVASVQLGPSMGELANGVKRTRRKSRVPARFSGKDLVFEELKKRGFDAQLSPGNMKCSSGRPTRRLRPFGSKLRT
jgi:hypothetical protein